MRALSQTRSSSCSEACRLPIVRAVSCPPAFCYSARLKLSLLTTGVAFAFSCVGEGSETSCFEVLSIAKERDPFLFPILSLVGLFEPTLVLSMRGFRPREFLLLLLRSASASSLSLLSLVFRSVTKCDCK